MDNVTIADTSFFFILLLFLQVIIALNLGLLKDFSSILKFPAAYIHLQQKQAHHDDAESRV